MTAVISEMATAQLLPQGDILTFTKVTTHLLELSSLARSVMGSSFFCVNGIRLGYILHWGKVFFELFLD